MTLSQPSSMLPWLVQLYKQLTDLHKINRLPHAILIQGAEGIGKMKLAEALGHFLLCHKPVDGWPCGGCRSCQLNNSGGHPDLYRLTPEEQGKAIRVDQIRALGEFIHNTAQQGGYRIVIIDPADAMNNASANALLKSLEEPGNNTLLILLTHQSGQIMPTIKSRCQRYDLPLPEEDIAVAWVVDHLSCDEVHAKQLLNFAHGSPVKATTYESDGHKELRAMLISGLADTLKQRRNIIEVAAQWQKQDLELMLAWWLGLLTDIARIRYVSKQAAQFGDASNMLQAVAKRVQSVALFELHQAVQEAHKELRLRQNANKQLMLEQLLIKWIELI